MPGENQPPKEPARTPVIDIGTFREKHNPLPQLVDILDTNASEEEINGVTDELKAAILTGIDKEGRDVALRALELLTITDSPSDLVGPTHLFRSGIPPERTDLMTEILSRLQSSARMYKFWRGEGPDRVWQELAISYREIARNTGKPADTFPLISVLVKLAEDPGFSKYPQAYSGYVFGVLLVEYFAEQDDSM